MSHYQHLTTNEWEGSLQLWTVSLFGRYSVSGLTALSIIYPIQLLIIALAVGTGVGVKAGRGKKERSR